MSSAGAQCNHIAHVSTQMPYALTAAIVSFLTYIVAGFAHNAPVCLLLGLVVMFFAMYLLRYVMKGTGDKVTMNSAGGDEEQADSLYE